MVLTIDRFSIQWNEKIKFLLTSRQQNARLNSGNSHSVSGNIHSSIWCMANLVKWIFDHYYHNLAQPIRWKSAKSDHWKNPCKLKVNVRTKQSFSREELHKSFSSTWRRHPFQKVKRPLIGSINRSNFPLGTNLTMFWLGDFHIWHI